MTPLFPARGAGTSEPATASCCTLYCGIQNPICAASARSPRGSRGPSSELDFWTRKAAALGSLHEQLRSEQLQQALRTLEAARSTFLPAFTRYHRQAISLTWP